MRGFILILTWLSICVSPAFAQDSSSEAKLRERLEEYFKDYKAKNVDMIRKPRLQDCLINDSTKSMTITVDEIFSTQDFSPEVVEKIYKKIRKTVPDVYEDYQISVITNGMEISELIPNRLLDNPDKTRLWGDIEYRGEPWVSNVSRPNKITHGLRNRHISLWASHGRYYDQKKGFWKWQRPNLFGTTEDLFTQTIVVPYLIPMLENAGAVVFTPRERDWQKNEFIVDNDKDSSPYYSERNAADTWSSTGIPGFSYRQGMYVDGENPFTHGTARMAATTHGKHVSQITYQPNITQGGRYAVYVSYQTVSNSIDDAQYIVYHKGQATEFRVNQRMGGSTWVYLGTFDFDQGCNAYNRIVLTNHSKRHGVVTADAVRFGGGMGNIERGGTVSGFPRCLEGARYYSQWAGAPYSAYSSKNGVDDYADDINTRSHVTNWLAGGSVYAPNIEGKNVPIELSLGVHSDAGFSKDYSSLIGSLSICTTNYNDGKLNGGLSRMASRDLADALLDGVYRDLRYKYGRWRIRALYDRNYSESRLPEVPSSILETLSHQSFPDMIYGQDPNFKFTLARSIYKTILRYVSDQHEQPFVIQPLQPDNFRIEYISKNRVMLSWDPVNDPQEPSARPSSYIVYKASGPSGFDNGTVVKSPFLSVELNPDVLYQFKVTAINKGGESFPTETLSALYTPNAKKTILIVNGFHRLSSPAIHSTTQEQGFDLDKDIGVSYGPTAGWNGRQLCFDKAKIGIEGPGGLGYGGDEYAGMFIAGNSFNYVKTHAEAIRTTRQYNIVSCSSKAVETGKVNINKYPCVDLILGLEKNDGRSLVSYKTFSPAMQQKLRHYTKVHGALLVSGSYIGSDMTEINEQHFLSQVLKLHFAGDNRYCTDSKIYGMGTSFDIYRTLNETHYAVQSPDILQAVAPAYCALQYANGQSACVAYQGKDYRSFTMGFPFECITDHNMRGWIMKGILNFLLAP